MKTLSRTNFFLAVASAATLLIGVASVALYLKAFPPYFRGWGEVTTDRKVAGWAINQSAPSERVEVQLYIDGRFISGGIADIPRPDVVMAGWTRDEHCGYSFDIPTLTAGYHDARVFALHKVGTGDYQTLQLSGDPLRFRVEENGGIRALK